MSDTVETQGDLGNTITKSLRARGWCFTLNNYTDEEYEQLKTHGHTKCIKWIIGKEVAPTTGTKHLQGYFYHKNSRTLQCMKKINNRLHLERSKGSPEENLTYCSKAGEAEHEGFIKLKDTIKKKLLARYESVIWKPWQQELLKTIESKPDTRTINWIYDPIGNSGKSFLTKYLALTHEVIIADGKKDNIFNQVNKKLNEDEIEFELVILDIPRSSEGYVNYGVLEQLKNGLLYSGKYEGGICLFDDVHVIVFANFEPDYTQFSEDRWNVIKI
nr:MAG: replication associated protein [Cressdnaviricota sp.]